MYGRTYDDHRFSPLNQIKEVTVGKLGLAWSRELGGTRGLEGTPLVENGVLYVTGPWSLVYALDAKTGSTRWRYDPKVPRERARFLNADAVNRGVALYQDNVYVGTLDGRPIALDKRSGAPVWSVSTTDSAQAYSITGAPRIAVGWSSWEMPVRSMAYVAMFLRSTPKPGRWHGAFTPFPAIHRMGSNRRICKSPRRRGAASGGKPEAAAAPGKGSSMTPCSICCISEPATPLPGIARSVAEATVSTPPLSSPFTPVAADWRGTFKPLLGTIGILMQRNP